MVRETVFLNCTTIHKYPIFNTRYSVMCKVYTGYHGTGEIEHGLCACTVDNPIAKVRGLSLRTGAQTMLYLSHKTYLDARNRHVFSTLSSLPMLNARPVRTWITIETMIPNLKKM